MSTAGTPGRRTVTWDAKAQSWRVTFGCCSTQPMHSHFWTVAQRVAAGHRCPPPIAPVRFTRPKRLTRAIR